MLRTVAVVGLVFLFVGVATSSTVTFDDGFSCVNVSDTDGLMDSPWPMLGHDPQHTGRSPYDTSMNKGWIKWKFEGERMVTSPVVDVDGTIYVAGNEFLYAVNPDGTLKWVFETRPGTKGWIGGTPAISEDGIIYVGDRNGYLYAVRQDGREKWRINIAGTDWIFSPAIGEDGTIYLGSTNGILYAVCPNGTLKWNVTVGDFAFTPAIGLDGNIYIGTLNRYLSAVSPDGEIVWRVKVHGPLRDAIAVGDDGTVYIGTSLWPGSNYFYAFYPNGTLKWKYPGLSYIMGIAIGEDGTLYFATGAGSFYALDKEGVLKWKIKISDSGVETLAFPVIGKDGTIYMVAEWEDEHIEHGQCGYLCAISPYGSVKWRKKLGAAKPYDVCDPSGLAIGGDGTVYVTTWFSGKEGLGVWGYLYAFGAGEPNNPPCTPIMDGVKLGIQGVEYEYILVAVDPEGDPVSYFVSWGDSTFTGWTREYSSGEKITLSHRWWYEKLKFSVAFQAKDIYDNEGGWSSFDVVMLRVWGQPFVFWRKM